MLMNLKKLNAINRNRILSRNIEYLKKNPQKLCVYVILYIKKNSSKKLLKKQHFLYMQATPDGGL